MNPLVTIAIPTLGRIDLFVQALASARAQTYSPFEILVGDNGADAETTRKISAVTDGIPNLRTLRQSRRLSMADHWNALADDARGELFCILADDDLLEPEFLSRTMALRERDPVIGICFSDHRIIDSVGRVDVPATEFYSRENGRTALAEGRVSDSAATVWRGSVPICASLIRTELARDHRFRGDLNTPELEFFARLAADGVGFAYVAEKLARYRVHGNSETQSLGLKNDLLFRALKVVPAPESAEVNRRAMLENLLVTSVSQALRKGDMRTAREFLSDPLYPRRGRPVSRLQKLAAKFPDFAAPSLFRALYRALRPLRGRRPLSQ